MEKKEYTKLSDLVDKDFTVQEVYGYQWKKWDNESKRMLIADSWEEGYRKVYAIVSDKGQFDISAGQLGNMLESVSKKGVSDINGLTFHVKSNGKTGIDIRYYINPKSLQRKEVEKKEDIVVSEEDLNDPIDLSEIPF